MTKKTGSSPAKTELWLQHKYQAVWKECDHRSGKCPWTGTCRCNNSVPLCKNHSKIMSPKISIFIIIWPQNISLGPGDRTIYELRCTDPAKKGWQTMTNVTWICDQENGKLFCKSSLTNCNFLMSIDAPLRFQLGTTTTTTTASAESVKHQIEEVRVETLQSEAPKIGSTYWQMLPLILCLYFCCV